MRYLELVVGLIFTIVGLVLTGVAVVTGLHASGAFADEVQTTGTIVELTERTSRDRDGHRTVMVRPTVEYQVEGATYTLRSTTGRSVGSWEVGDEVEVAYHRDDPSRARLAGAIGYLVTWITGPMALVFLAIGVPFLVIGARRLRRDRRLRRIGVPAVGQVAGIEINHRRTSNGRKQRVARIVWWHPTSGTEQTTEDRYYDDRWTEGDRVHVIYDPEDPALAMVAGPAVGGAP
jgi:hypothetical protein